MALALLIYTSSGVPSNGRDDQSYQSLESTRSLDRFSNEIP